VAVARSVYDGDEIRYVLPVLWTTLCFHVKQEIIRTHRRHVFRPVRQVAAPFGRKTVLVKASVPRAKSVVSDCILLPLEAFLVNQNDLLRYFTAYTEVNHTKPSA